MKGDLPSSDADDEIIPVSCQSTELEEAPKVDILGGFDVHRKQITFDYMEMESGEVHRGKIQPADRENLRLWLECFTAQLRRAEARGKPISHPYPEQGRVPSRDSPPGQRTWPRCSCVTMRGWTNTKKRIWADFARRTRLSPTRDD